MKKFITGILITSLVVLAGCTTIKNDPSLWGGSCGLTAGTGACTDTGNTQPQRVDMTNSTQVADMAIQALKNKDMSGLNQITSKEGIRFSPYSFINTGKDIVLKKDDLANIISSKTEYVRGNADGTGDPIILTFSKYMDKYIYDVDFAKLAEKHINENLIRGNTINNSSDVYPGKYIIEYYVPGIDPQYEGMDWRALSLVFQKEDNEWKLIGIIHNQWTI